MFKKGLISTLCLCLLCLCVCQPINVEAASGNGDDYSYYAKYDDGQVEACIGCVEKSRIKIEIFYYDYWHEYIIDKEYTRTSTFYKIKDTPPESSDHALVKFYLDGKKVVEKYVYY